MSDPLAALGWDRGFARAFATIAQADHEPARVVVSHGGLHRTLSRHGELLADLAGRLRHAARSGLDLPVVGDWVALSTRVGESRATIHAVVPRRTRFVRGAPGEDVADQVVAANVDCVFLVVGLDRDFNLRRLERYLSLAHASGARAVVLLNKADACPDVDERCDQARGVAEGVPVHAISARQGLGLDALSPHLEPRRTVALLGSSGVGKSTLVNRLLGSERQRVGGLRRDQRGRHTTSSRELIVLPSGALLVDTPGLREIQLQADHGVRDAFDDVTRLAAGCRFRDCGHEAEPGCAVAAAVGDGRLDPARLESFRKLRREARDRDHRARVSGRRTPPRPEPGAATGTRRPSRRGSTS